MVEIYNCYTGHRSNYIRDVVKF